MNTRHFFPGLLATFFLVSGAGCGKSKSESSSAPPASSALSAATVLRAHWLGKKRLGIEAGAYYFMRVWGMPETARLEAQTLDKLSSAPWRFMHGEAAGPGAPVALFRPLLGDLVQEESYMEVRQATNQPAAFVIAIRLDNKRAGAWETNLATVVESLTGLRPATVRGNHRGWLLTQQRKPSTIELARVGAWTVVGVANEKNALVSEIVERIERYRVPFHAPETDYWLKAEFDSSRAADFLGPGWNLPKGSPGVSVVLTGDGANVHTRGEFTFPTPPGLELEAWNIPTQLLQEPLVSFTAIRGIKHWLTSAKAWSSLQVASPPGQIFFWAPTNAQLQVCFAAPLVDAEKQVHGATDVLLREGNAWIATNGIGKLERLPDANGLTWTGLPLLTPFLKSVVAGNEGLVFGGLLPETGPKTNPPPAALIQDVLGRTNLVYYDWEMTGPRVEPALFITQVFRVATRHPQLSLECASSAWLNAIRHRLAHSTTVVTTAGTRQLSFERRSTLGFTGAELQILADWLESPQFPRGSFTLLAPTKPPQTPGSVPAQR